MNDSPAFVQARNIVRERVDNLIKFHGAYNEDRVNVLHLALQAYFCADVSLAVLEEIIAAADDLRQASEGDADIIGRNHRDEDYAEKQQEAKDNCADQQDAKIRELLTGRVLAEYVAREMAA